MLNGTTPKRHRLTDQQLPSHRNILQRADIVTHTHTVSSITFKYQHADIKTSTYWKKRQRQKRDTDRRQPNAAWITTMWFSMNSPIVSQTGGRARKQRQSFGKPSFFPFCCYCIPLPQQSRSVHMCRTRLELQSSSRFLVSWDRAFKGIKCAVISPHAYRANEGWGWNIGNQARKSSSGQKHNFSD